MENNDSNIKSQQTGGLKLMTVFIAVLALHVVVIGGFTVYHLMSGGTTDSDMTTTTDKTHKSMDSTTTDTTTADKSTTTVAPAEVATIPATPTVTPASAPAPTGDTVTPSVASPITPAPTATATPIASTTVTPVAAPAPITTPALTLAQPTPTPIAASTVANPSAQTPTGPIAPALLPPQENAAIVAPAPAPMAPVVAPAASSLAAGPVHMPPANKDASRVTHVAPHQHEQVYTVKITDSYKKIAKAHHVTVAQLKEANGIKGDTLHTGQKLFIPSGKNEVAESTAATASLASEPAVTHPSVAPMTTGLSSTTTAATTASSHHLYTIEKGDTLNKIARKFKTTPTAIMAANSNLDPTKLTIGHKLHIPSKESRSAQIAAPIAQPVPVAQPAQVQQAKSAASTPAAGELTSFSL